MKKRFVPALALGAALSLMIGAAATAAPRFGKGMHGRGPGGPEGRADRLEFLADYLSLTAAQKAQVQKLQEALDARTEPLREEQRRLHGEIREALDNDADAATVGTLVIASHEGREKIHALREENRNAIEALLTPAQVARWEALKDAQDARKSRRRSHHDGPPVED